MNIHFRTLIAGLTLVGAPAALVGAPSALAADGHKPVVEHSAPPKVVTPIAKPESKAEAKASAPAEGKAAHAEAKAEPAPVAKPAPAARVEPAPRARPAAPAPAHSTISPATRQRAVATVAARSAEPEHAAPAAEHAAHPPHWSYEGPTGPQSWAKLAPEYAKCGSGERQSPIDIRDGLRVDLEPIAFEYRPSSFKVVDNGHTIQVNVNGWNSIRLMGRQFRLVQFHFHRPSEEMIDGKQFEMVVHLVHQDSQGKLAVVAVLIEKGARQPVLQTVLNNLPLEQGQEIAVNGSSIDLAQMLPSDRRYFTYMGSLTTPPCTEDVLWIVMKQPAQATNEQLNLFARLYPMNARPLQDSKGRTIKESN